MFIETAKPNQTKLQRSDMPPRWGLKSSCMVVSYNHAAPPALDALQEEVDALKHLRAGTAANLNALLPAILVKPFKKEL